MRVSGQEDQQEQSVSMLLDQELREQDTLPMNLCTPRYIVIILAY